MSIRVSELWPHCYVEFSSFLVFKESVNCILSALGKYDDIINLPHHVSENRRPMPMENRAAQFAPFAALSGHDKAIAETARLTEPMAELSDDEKTTIERKLKWAIENKLTVEISYFHPDKTKSGGSYRKIQGVIKKWDEFDKLLILENNRAVRIEYIQNVVIKR